MVSRFRALRWCLTVAMPCLFVFAGGALAASAQDAPPADSPYRVNDGVSRPEKISGAAPVYTELARRARVTGTVIVEAIIDKQGNVVSAKVLKGLPMGLDRAAVDAVETWKFKPAMNEGKPVKVYYVVTVNFKVEGAAPLGPQLKRFLQANPELAEILKAKRYTEATAFLDRLAAERSAEPELTTARCYLLLSQSRLEDAWEVAESYRGPDPYEMLALIGGFAQVRASYDQALSPEGRAAVIDLGLQAATMALETRPEGLDAMISKLLLLREKAKLTGDPVLENEATQLQQQALELQARLREAAGPKQ
jgi:TonB family protein